MTIKLKALGLLLCFLALPISCILLVNYFGQYMAYFLFGLSLLFFYFIILQTLKEKEEFEKRFSK
jgi:uncharacterized RDD family membrane protein YckC